MAYEKRPPAKKIMVEGIAVYPRLNEPDFKFKKDKGEFQCRVLVARSAVEALLAELDAAAKTAYDDELANLKAKLAAATTGAEKAKLKERIAKYELASPCYKDDVDEEGEPNGNVILNFKMPHRVTYTEKSGKEVTKLFYPNIFDAAGKPMKSPPPIWGGSTLVVAGEVRPFAAPLMAGVSLRLSGVQLINLVSGGAQTAEGLGFSKREGYEASDEETTAPTKAAEEGEDSGSSNEDF